MSEEVIEMHSSWLAINSVVGCTNGCKYCFLQSTNKNLLIPKQLVTPREAVNQLLHSKYYVSEIPICLLPNTDPFLNYNNIKYLIELIEEIKYNNISNIITIVTKCLIPDYFIDILKKNELTDQVIIYLSFSGLDNEIEPNVKHEDIRKNFINLHNNNIKVIHYFRPLIPQNSNTQTINSTLNFVKNYTDISVITGLKLKKDYINNIDFWNEIKEYQKEALEAEGVWTKEAFDFFYTNYNLDNKIFQTNTCALSSKLSLPVTQYYDTNECKNYNICSFEQRKLCKEAKKSISESTINHKIISELKKLNKYNNKIKIEFDKNNEVIIYNVDLQVGDLAYLSYVCGVKILSGAKSTNETYFNSSLNNSKPLILRRKI